MRVKQRHAVTESRAHLNPRVLRRRLVLILLLLLLWLLHSRSAACHPLRN